MNWLTEELEEEIREVFEPRYQRELNKTEVQQIATNLTNFMETYCKWKMKKDTNDYKNHV